jgi:hypothetical protein
MFLGFVHVPKTGGSTIISEGKIKIDGEFCNNSSHAKVSELMRHEHEHKYISLMRDPYQQSISKYYNMLRNHKGDMNFTLKDFLTNEEHRLWSEISYFIYYDILKPSEFSFIGITEEMEKNRIILKKMFGIEFSKKPLNTNNEKIFYKKYKTTFYEKEFKKIHKDEYDLYHEGIHKFNQLCKKYL